MEAEMRKSAAQRRESGKKSVGKTSAGRPGPRNRHGRLTPVSMFHYFRLTYRSMLLLAFLFFYIRFRCSAGSGITDLLESRPVILWVLWLVFAVEMILRFFPSRLESPGCQKQFACNYQRSGETEIVIHDNNATMLVALIWISLNAVFGVLHMTGIFDDGIMILISCAYSVCDMICILFFCPFQSWFLKNKCCSSCRIYNWDYAMIFTPLFFVRKPYGWSLLAMSVVLMLRWEITFYRYPERFSEKTNLYLRCENCTEKLCAHKKQLRSLWREIEQYTAQRIKKLRG